MLFRILIPPHRSNIAIKCNLILFYMRSRFFYLNILPIANSLVCIIRGDWLDHGKNYFGRADVLGEGSTMANIRPLT